MSYPIPRLSQTSLARIDRPFIQGFISEGLEIITADSSFAGPNLSKWFRQQRILGSRDRKIVAEVIYLLIRFERWFIASKLLEAPLLQRPSLHKVYQWLQKATSSENLQEQFDLATHLSVESWLIEELGSIPEMEAFAHHYQQRAPVDIRCNSHRISRTDLLKKLEERNIHAAPIPNTTHGLRIADTVNLHAEPLFQQGFFEIQDAASQYFMEALQSKLTPTSTVLDFCAGAGGKALACAALGAKVYAHEPRTKAMEELSKRAARSGLNILQKLPKDPVDIVIVDAPCSGTGRLRREATLRWKWMEKSPLEWVPIQNEILQQAATFVKDEGIIAYATCSILPAENAHELHGWKAERHRVWGHLENCDGFSWTLFRKKDAL